MRAEIARSVVDGNAAAGLLMDAFGADVTALTAVCGGCGAVSSFAETVVELDEVAAIVRCRTCTHTLLTVLRDARGTRAVIGMLREVRRPAADLSRAEA